MHLQTRNDTSLRFCSRNSSRLFYSPSDAVNSSRGWLHRHRASSRLGDAQLKRRGDLRDGALVLATALRNILAGLAAAASVAKGTSGCPEFKRGRTRTRGRREANVNETSARATRRRKRCASRARGGRGDARFASTVGRRTSRSSPSIAALPGGAVIAPPGGARRRDGDGSVRRRRAILFRDDGAAREGARARGGGERREWRETAR